MKISLPTTLQNVMLNTLRWHFFTLENFSLGDGDSSNHLSSMAHIQEEVNSEYYVLKENFHKVGSGQCLRSIELYAVLFFKKKLLNLTYHFWNVDDLSLTLLKCTNFIV